MSPARGFLPQSFVAQDADCDNAGQPFATVRGVTFQYYIVGSTVVPRHTHYPLHRSQFEIAAVRWPVAGPGELNQIVRGPAYIFAILRDPRIGL